MGKKYFRQAGRCISICLNFYTAWWQRRYISTPAAKTELRATTSSVLCKITVKGVVTPEKEWKLRSARETQMRRGRQGESFVGNIYGTGERNPWEFSSLAYESNSSSRKRQTFSSEPVVRSTSSRWAKSFQWVRGSQLILPCCVYKSRINPEENVMKIKQHTGILPWHTAGILTNLYNTCTMCSPYGWKPE